jgi:hypothetical protein
MDFSVFQLLRDSFFSSSTSSSGPCLVVVPACFNHQLADRSLGVSPLPFFFLAKQLHVARCEIDCSRSIWLQASICSSSLGLTGKSFQHERRRRRSRWGARIF